ncbi:MAG: CAP domain-containing protein [Actinomycetota bacterium]|nr:CAP domain-containing protein [Actinomycetota bacterium]
MLTTRALKALSLYVVVLVCVPLIPSKAEIAPVGTADVSSGFSYKRTERCLMRRINRVRSRHGLGRLDGDRQLAYVARKHANSMAASRGVWHDPNVGSEVTRWRRLGQNTGRGRSCKSLTRSFMNSHAHRSHILGRFRHFAVGVKRAGGSIYVQELFESRRNPGNIYHYP